MKAATLYASVSTIVVTLCLSGTTLHGAAGIVEIDSTLDVYSTYNVNPRKTLTDSFNAPTVAAWAAANYVGVTSLGPLTGTFLNHERHEARTTFEQPPNADATLRTFLRSSGWYYGDGNNHSRSEVHILNEYVVNNPTPNPVRIVMFHQTHGIVASGGDSNKATAEAQEVLIVYGAKDSSGASTHASRMSIHAEGQNFTPTTSITGDWAGFVTPTTYRLPDSGMDIQALEVARSTVFKVGNELQPNSSISLGVEFFGTYDVRSAPYGMFSAGVVDFSSTGRFEFYAEDPASGARVPGVTFTLVDPVPEPVSAVVGAAFLAALFAGRRKR